MQTYRGQQVFTWWQGAGGPAGGGTGVGVDVIVSLGHAALATVTRPVAITQTATSC